LADTESDIEGATVKAIQVATHGGPEVLHPVELLGPEPGPGEVPPKAAAAAVNFYGLMGRRGNAYPVPAPLPSAPGAVVAQPASSLQRLSGRIAARQVRPHTVRPLPLADAAGARRLTEAGAITGKVVLTP
jgi:NADPH:quinone reductase-like Zn-dependent oxidoreductase